MKEFRPREAETAVESSKAGKSPGPDEVLPEVIKFLRVTRPDYILETMNGMFLYYFLKNSFI